MADLNKIKKDAGFIRRMLELGDGRLLAHDGPCGGQMPDLWPKEWAKVYKACKRIVAEIDRQPQPTTPMRATRSPYDMNSLKEYPGD